MAFVALAALLVCGAATGASAQGFGWFGNLFGGPPVRQPAQQSQQPAYPGHERPYRGGSPREVYRRHAPPSYGASPSPPRHIVRHRALEPQTPREQAERAPPKNASLFVYVYGDSLGQQLATGLDDALSDRQDVAVIHRARDVTGLVSGDTYDWTKAIQDLRVASSSSKDQNAAAKPATTERPAATDRPAATEKAGKPDAMGKIDASGKTESSGKPDPAGSQEQPSGQKPEKIDVAVMMIGSNDRQPIRADGKVLAFGTDAWTAAYRKKVLAIDEAFRKNGIPLVWVGVPITKNDDFADDMAALNEIYRTTAAQTGATYVDTWEAFSDDDGDFNAFGPDINGQTVRLRSTDGIYFTRAGARKLAHFVDTHIRRALDGKTPPAELPTLDQPDVAAVPAGKPAEAGKPVAAVKPDAGPIRNLNEVPASNGQLAVANAFRSLPDKDRLVETTLVKGQAQAVPAGRADDLHWPTEPAPK